MDSSAETKKAPSGTNKLLIVAAMVIIALLVLIVVLLARPSTTDSGTDGPKVGYASEATVLLDEDSLQAAVDEAMENAKKGQVALQYQNDAFSEDGKNFSCYIANAPANLYDMFLTIYADAELTDQIYLSGLVPPGSGFQGIVLDHALELGDHTVYVAVSQVETDEETGAQVIRNQVMHTMTFHVEQ